MLWKLQTFRCRLISAKFDWKNFLFVQCAGWPSFGRRLFFFVPSAAGLRLFSMEGETIYNHSACTDWREAMTRMSRTSFTFRIIAKFERLNNQQIIEIVESFFAGKYSFGSVLEEHLYISRYKKIKESGLT